MSSYSPWLLASVLSLPIAAVAAPQDPETPTSAARDRQGRFLVTLRDRGFDLGEYGSALRSRDAGRARALVSTLENAARTDQAALVDFVAAELGGRVVDQWWIVNGFAVELEASKVARLRAHPRVASVVPDQVRHVGSFIKTATNASNHAADLVHAQGVRGKGTTLAVVDSGVDSRMGTTNRPHATFFVNGDVNNQTGGGIAGSRLLANKKIGAMSEDDIIAHGTAVAGVAAGARWNQGANADDGHAPLASIVSYSLADDLAGGTYASTLTTAWQTVAADRLTYGTSVAVCSYEGWFDTSFPDQQAIEVLATIGDVVVVGMAGNGNAGSGFVYGATNMLAVGAVQPDTRVVAAFSARGPMLTDPARFYPDLVANGVGMLMPKADDEASDKVGTGTSYSAPQVAGAALLYRSLRPLATATEVKAAILATCEDVAGKNLTPPNNSRNTYGSGYLRDDQLVALASGRGLLQNATLSPSVPSRTFKFLVAEGQRYAVALAWFRADPTLVDWANLDLEVRFGGQVLATSATTRNVHELVRFRAPSSGLVDLVVSAKSFEPGKPTQAFAIAATESLPYYVVPQLTRFGTGCGRSPLPDLRPSTGEPRLGTTYELGLTNGLPLRGTLSLVGASRTHSLGFTLPLDLTSFGGVGCTWLASADVTFPGVTNLFGIETYRFNLPIDSALLDVSIYHQVFVAAPSTNALGAISTNAIAARIGGG